MRLTLSKSNHMNADISDEQGNILYNISTPSTFFSKSVTTITKYDQLDDEKRDSETMGLIEWPRIFDKGSFWFNGRTIPVGMMFEKHTWKSGLYFSSDRQRYKWKLQSHLWMKRAESNEELVRYHRKNLGILKPSHPAYLDVSPKVVFMLDLIVLTFVYAEWLRKVREAQAVSSAT